MTLVEVMMAFAILVTGLVGIFAVLNAGFRSHKRAVNETEAGIIAASVIAELRAEFSHGRVPRSDPKGTYTLYPNSSVYRLSKQIIPLEAARKGIEQKAADREYFVRVEVRWAEAGDNKGISLDTIIYCNRKD